MSDSIDSNVRQAVVRDICNREGHGKLRGVTSFMDRGAAIGWSLLCERGCGVEVVEVRPSTSAKDLLAWLETAGFGDAVFTRARVELWEEKLPGPDTQEATPDA